MKITIETLEKYGVNKQFVEYLETNGLLGGDLIKIINEETPTNLLYFLRKFIKFNKEEEEKYLQICGVDTHSRNIWESNNVTNSANVVRSININSCDMIRDSKNITDSKQVYYSDGVYGSNEVSWSYEILSSDFIYRSSKIQMSEMVARSNNVSWSESVLCSSQISECGYIYQSENLEGCYFCGFMNRCNNCLFCTGLEDKEYHIFNKPVDPQDYARMVDELRERLQTEESKMIEITNMLSAEERYNVSRRFDTVFNGLSSDFYGWVGNTINYSDDVFVELFFADREENLKKKEK